MKRKTRSTHAAALLTAAVIAAAATPLPAQTPPAGADTIPLREIVVTATRLPTPLHAVPAAVTVITGEELRARGVRFVADALRTVPGAQLAGGGSPGAITSLFLRGGQSDYVQVLIDGVQVNEPGGAYDFAHLATHDIERIEIVRGPVSVLYGTDAVAGVVQIFTREGHGAPSLSASVEGGRYGKGGATPGGSEASGGASALAFDASLAGEAAGVHYKFGAARSGSDGLYTENSDYLNRSLSARATWRSGARFGNAAARRTPPATASDAAISARWTDHRYHFPTDGAGRIVDLNQFSTGTSLVAGLDAGRYITPRVEARLGAQLHRNETGFDDRPDSPADTLGAFAAESEALTLRRSIDARTNLYGQRAVLTLGGAAAWQEGRSRYVSYSEWGPWESESDDARSNRAAFAQLATSPVAALTLTLGGRLDDSDMFGGYTTYRAGANVRVAPFATLRASVATAFKEPTFYQNFASGYVTGNAGLQPERSRSAELGALVDIGSATLNLTVYRQRFADMIQFDGRPREQRRDEPNYYNLGAASADGVELDVTARVMPALELRGGYNFGATEVTDAGLGSDRAFLDGRSLLRRPAHSGSLVATVTPRRDVRLALTGRFVGERDDLDFAGAWQGARISLEPYAVFDVAGELTALRTSRLGEFALTVRIENLFDAQYEDIANFPGRGRALYLGARAR
jgi:vitamin B12 transporter